MTRPLSIFSFDTLRVRPGVPRSLLVALLVVLSAEGAVRYHRAESPEVYGPNLGWMMQDYRRAARDGSADLWLLGNSTLAVGIDKPAFEALAGVSSVKMPHGSSSVAGYDALLGYYLGQAPAPERLILCINKDDLSRFGPRTDVSEKYLDYARQSPLRPSHWLTLSFASTQLRELAVQEFDAAYSSLRGQATAKSQQFDHGSVQAMVFDPQLKPVAENSILSGVVAAWSYDEQSLRSIVDRARRAGVEQVGVVLMPCTDALAAYHNAQLPEEDYAQVRERTRNLLTSMDVSVLDLAVATNRYDLFSDSYHLNATGRRVLTRAVGEWVAQGMPATDPMTEHGFDTLARRVLDEGERGEKTRVVVDLAH